MRPNLAMEDQAISSRIVHGQFPAAGAVNNILVRIFARKVALECLLKDAEIANLYTN